MKNITKNLNKELVKSPLNYPGNKNKILTSIIDSIPEVENFYDVFCGSAVVAVNSKSQKIILNDINNNQIELLKYLYKTANRDIMKQIKDTILKFELTSSDLKPKGFYKIFKYEGLSNYNRKGFDLLKDEYNRSKNPLFLLVLSFYSFNHYIRFNKKNKFNVPVGKVDFTKKVEKELNAFCELLKKKTVEFLSLDFRSFIEKTTFSKHDILYFDPPYLVTSAPYSSSWGETDELELLNILDKINLMKGKFVLSNVLLSNGKRNYLLEEWSKKYNVKFLNRQYRNANYRRKNLSETIEVIITNF